MVLNPLLEARSRMSISSARCRSALSVSFDGQLMLRTVATQRPRISRARGRGISSLGEGAVDGRTHPTTRTNAPNTDATRNAEGGIRQDGPYAGDRPASARKM